MSNEKEMGEINSMELITGMMKLSVMLSDLLTNNASHGKCCAIYKVVGDTQPEALLMSLRNLITNGRLEELTPDEMVVLDEYIDNTLQVFSCTCTITNEVGEYLNKYIKHNNDFLTAFLGLLGKQSNEMRALMHKLGFDTPEEEPAPTNNGVINLQDMEGYVAPAKDTVH